MPRHHCSVTKKIINRDLCRSFTNTLPIDSALELASGVDIGVAFGVTSGGMSGVKTGACDVWYGRVLWGKAPMVGHSAHTTILANIPTVHVRSYLNLFAERRKMFQDGGKTLSLQMILPKGIPCLCSISHRIVASPHFNLVHKGNLRVEMHFDERLDQTVNVIIYGEFELVSEIVRNRNVVYD